MATRPSAEAWQIARSTWEADPKQNFETIAKTMGVSRVAVSKRANDKDDPWVRVQSMREIVTKAQRRADEREVAAKVSADAAKVSGVTTKRASEEAAVDLRADVLERHRSDWVVHRSLFTTDEIKAQFEVGKAAKISAEMLAIRQKGERAAYGIEDAPQSDPIQTMSDAELEAEIARHRQRT